MEDFKLELEELSKHNKGPTITSPGNGRLYPSLN